MREDELRLVRTNRDGGGGLEVLMFVVTGVLDRHQCIAIIDGGLARAVLSCVLSLVLCFMCMRDAMSQRKRRGRRHDDEGSEH